MFDVEISDAQIGVDEFQIADAQINRLVTLKPAIPRAVIEMNASWKVDALTGGMRVLLKPRQNQFLQANIARWREHSHIPVDGAARIARYEEVIGNPPPPDHLGLNHVGNEDLNKAGGDTLRNALNANQRTWEGTKGFINLEATVHIFSVKEYANIPWKDKTIRTGPLEAFNGKFVPNRIRARGDFKKGEWLNDFLILQKTSSKDSVTSPFNW